LMLQPLKYIKKFGFLILFFFRILEVAFVTASKLVHSHIFLRACGAYGTDFFGADAERTAITVIF
jgi:hypothetical protein